MSRSIERDSLTIEKRVSRGENANRRPVDLSRVHYANGWRVALDECEQQRMQYPKNWNDVSKEKGLFDCNSHYAGALRVKVGTIDSKGRTLISLVPLERTDHGIIEDTTKTIYRIWLDQEQTQRLRDGKYFATIVRSERSCWIRGDLGEDSVFLIDNARPPSDGLREGAGSFYNKAPRFSVFQGNAYACEATK